MEQNKNKSLYSFICLFGSLLIVFLTYSFSLNRGWQFFDERMIYNEGLLPTPRDFGELLEIIKTYCFTYHFDSQNTFFSNLINVRSAPFGEMLKLVTALLLKNNAFLYHLLQLSIHLINTTLVWIIFHNLFKFKNLPYKSSLILSSLASLIWSLHPLNTEALMLATNWNSLLTHTFSFAFFLYVLKKVLNNCSANKNHEVFIVALFYIISLFLTEYSYILPVVLFFVSFGFSFKKFNEVKKSLDYSINLSKPFIYGLIVFFCISLIKSIIQFKSNLLVAGQPLNFSVERVLWLSPQIFFHFLKLFFFPKNLSLHQTNLLNLPDSLFSAYAIFTLIFFLTFLTIPFLLFIKFKSSPEKTYFLPVIYAFVFSLVPFLHIVSPTYCLIAERYSYFPLFVFVFCLILLVSRFLTLNTKRVLFSLIIILITLQVRTVFRTFDWKDTFSLYNSALKCSKDDIYKGQIHSIISYYFKKIGNKNKTFEYAALSIKELDSGIKKLAKKRQTNIPKTLMVYGLDPISMLITCAFSISESRTDFLNEPAQRILNYYEPFIKPNLKYAGSSQLDLYAKLLLKTNNASEAEKVLQFAYKKYPSSPNIIYTLSNFYLNRNNLNEASNIVNLGYYYYPSYPRMLLRMIRLCELKKDYPSLAKYEYLLGLRAHSRAAYQKACQIYLLLKDVDKANICLKKLFHLGISDPVTILLRSKYLDLIGKKELVLPELQEAYKSAKIRYLTHQLDSHIYESILLSLISYNVSYNNINNAKIYIAEIETLPNLLSDSKIYIKSVKNKFQIK